MSVFLDGLRYTLDAATAGELGVLTATPAPPPAPTPTLAVLGDSFTAPDWTGPAGWPVQVATAHRLRLVNLGHAGAGYVRVDGWTLPVEATAMLPAEATVVLVWAGYNDRLIGLGGSAEQEYGARATFAAVRRIAPAAQLVVIGPQYGTGAPDGIAVASRDAVARAAADFDLPFVDSLRWLAGRPDLVREDGLHPNQTTGQGYLAGLIGPLVGDALARADTPDGMLAAVEG